MKLEGETLDAVNYQVKSLKLGGDVKIWARTDLVTRCFKTSNRSGPSWKDVKGRVTTELRTGKVIDVEDGQSITRSRAHRQIDRQRTMDTQTFLIYQGRCFAGNGDFAG